MDKNAKTLTLITLFVLFIGTAVFAYNKLGQEVSPQNNIDAAQNKEEDSQNNRDEQKEKLKAPDFTVLNVDGKVVQLSDLFGKPIVLNFWASWCPPCQSEMPEFNRVYEEVGDNITFMMVDIVDGQRETKEDGMQYIKEQGFSFPVYFDTEQDAANTYGIGPLPTTIFIDRDGNIVTGAQGAIDEATLRKGIELIN